MNNQNQQLVSGQISVLPGIVDLLKRSWQIYKAKLGTFFGIMAPPLIFSLLSLFLSPFLKNFPILAIFLLVVLWLGTIFISFWSQISLIYAIKDREEKIGIIESFKRGWRKILSFVWVSISAGFIITGGSLLFIIPGIIFAIWFSLAEYVLVSEDLKGMNAVFRSKQWVSGNWWKVFWRILAIFVITFIIEFGINFIFSFLFGEKIGDIANSVILIFLLPFSLTYSFLIYEDLKKFKGEIPFAPPKRGTKIKYILIGIVGFLLIPGIVLVSLVSLGGARSKARDARREADLRQLSVAQEMYYFDNGKYITLSIQNGTPAIGPYLPPLNDPQAPNKNYRWLDNRSCDQKFCVYAVLENKGNCSKTKWFVAYEGGAKEVCDKTEPINGCNCAGL